MDWTALDEVVADVVAPGAEATDASAEFPRKSIEALRGIGVLGLTTSVSHGGGGGSMADAARVVEKLAAACGSTAMVTLMHYAANALVEAHGPDATREAIGRGDHLTTLAFSEVGSRSHFWVPQGTATAVGESVRLDARKSWVTSAAAADSFVWSSRALDADGPMSLWLVPAAAPGLELGAPFEGLGLRGNGSVPVTATSVLIGRDALLGDDGAGLDAALASALPWFLVLSTAFAVGVMDAVLQEAGGFLGAARLEHLGATLIHQPVVRADYARMRLAADATRAFLSDTLGALASGRDDATLRVLESKALAAESLLNVTDLGMKACGGAAFRKELGIERRFRDACAMRVMAPTTDALLDFVGRAISGLPLFDA
jgi:alkylation response protein AidB-like acyl-CoA dehydrogenase